ncbi:MAG: ornithine carbamoyltransferase [Actinobacteria bacterium]|nr:ornithine carbamoyltransferase [Actinomycetota bacterium]
MPEAVPRTITEAALAPLAPLAKFRGRHYLTDQDYTREELLELLQLAVKLKALWRDKTLTPFLPGRTLAMLFEHPSTRTRVSFEAGMTELGGHAQYLRPGEIHLPGRESIKDTSIVLSRLTSAIMARTAYHSSLVELARWAAVPVVNGLTDDYDHLIQSLTDALTIWETAGSFDGLKLAFLGKVSDAMASSVALTCSRLGIDVVMAGPADHQMAPEMQRLVRANGEQSGATLTLTDDPVEAVAGADFIYTVLWWWLEEGEEREELRRTYRPFQVNGKLWAQAKPGARFMDCLPAVRGEEATDEIMDGPMSLCFDQSENRKHLQKAVLLALIGSDRLPDDPDMQEIGRALLV